MIFADMWAFLPLERTLPSSPRGQVMQLANVRRAFLSVLPVVEPVVQGGFDLPLDHCSSSATYKTKMWHWPVGQAMRCRQRHRL